MSLKIRLSRGGAKKRPFYRVVVADARSPRDGRFIERLGTFDPLAAKDSETRLVLDVEKAKEWLAKGAQPTDRVARLLDGVGAIKREPRNNPRRRCRRRRRRNAPQPLPPPPKKPPPRSNLFGSENRASSSCGRRRPFAWGQR